MSLLFIVLGVVCAVVNANGWFIIPVFVEYILFGIGGLGLLIQVIITIISGGIMNRVNKSFKNFR